MCLHVLQLEQPLAHWLDSLQIYPLLLLASEVQFLLLLLQAEFAVALILLLHSAS